MTLLVTIRRYKCGGCGHVWRQDTGKAADPRARPSREGLRWALEGIVVQHLTVARVAEALGVSWNTNDAVLAERKRVLINDPTRLDGLRVIGVDQHVWRHTHRGDKYVTVIIDLTAVRGTGPARLLDMVEGRSKQAFKQWLSDQTEYWRQNGEVVAMDGFTGFKTAITEELPDAVTVMDPLPRRSPGRRGAGRVPAAGSSSPRPPRPQERSLYAARRTLHTGADCHQQAERPAQGPVLGPGARRGRTDLGHLPAHDRCPPRTRPPPRPAAHAATDHHRRSRRPHRAERGDHTRAHADQTRRRRLGLLRPPRHIQRTDRSHHGRLEHLRGSASASATSPTTSPDRSWNRRIQTPTAPSIMKSHQTPAPTYR
jgi:hypothetical protein